MAIPKRTIRGVQSIRTYSGKVDIFSEPYRAFMQISALEMERSRRSKERESAVQRVRQIDARFREIEQEKTYLLKGLGGLKTIKTLALWRISRCLPRDFVRREVSKSDIEVHFAQWTKW